jgi:hypothetical protein
MLGLWLVQLLTKFDAIVGSAESEARITVGAIYMLLAVIIVFRNRRAVKPLLRDGFVARYDELTDANTVNA